MTKSTKKTDYSRDVAKITESFLQKLHIEASVDVSRVGPPDTTDEEVYYAVTVETQESGLLIGYHGETLNSLQLLLGVMLYKTLGVWVHIVVDVGKYRKMREETIDSMVSRMIEDVERTGETMILPFLTPLERRHVHLKLADHPTVESQSTGEGRERRLTIKLKAS